MPIWWTICCIGSENVFFPVSREGQPALIDFQLMKRMPAPFDGYYFLIMSVPSAWRQQHELELMNVFYDILVEQSGSDPEIYTWEQFCLEILVRLLGFSTTTNCGGSLDRFNVHSTVDTLHQITIPFYVNAFVFLAPEMTAQLDKSAPGHDPRKAELTTELCLRCKDVMQEWGCLSNLEEIMAGMTDRKVWSSHMFPLTNQQPLHVLSQPLQTRVECIVGFYACSITTVPGRDCRPTTIPRRGQWTTLPRRWSMCRPSGARAGTLPTTRTIRHYRFADGTTKRMVLSRDIPWIAVGGLHVVSHQDPHTW